MTIEKIQGTAKGEILVVEDNIFNMEYLSGILKVNGYLVRAANDGEQALISISTKLPDLILLDIQMPGIDGIEVCKRLKQNGASSEIPVIFLSAQDDTAVKVKALEVGGADYVTKPFQPFEILARIKTHLAISANIKKQKQLTAKLVKSETLLNAMGNMAHVGGWELDVASMQLIWTDEVFRMYEVTDDFAPTIENAIGFFTPEARPVISQAVQVTIDNGTSFDLELPIITAKGKKKNVYAHGEGRQCNGKTETVLVAFQDITERKRAEETLRESIESHRALIEGLPDVVMRFNREGRHFFVSDNVKEYVELEAPHFINKTHRELGFPEDMCLLWEDAIKRVFDNGKPYETEFAFNGKRGRTFFNWRLLPEVDTEGKTTSVLSLSRDISAQKRDEQLIAQSQFYLKKAQKIGKIGHFSLDPRTNVVVGSNELYRIFDVDADFGKPLLEAFAASVHPDDGHLIFPFIDNAVKEGLPYDVEHRVQHRDGTILNVHAKGELIDTPEGLKMVGTVQDITESTRMKEALQKTQKLESLGVLAGGIAHDFNNLLGAIYGYIDLAGEGAIDGKLSRYLSKAMNTIDRARALTQQLVTFSKGGAPKQEIGQLFPFVEETAKFALSGANVSCYCIIPQDLWACNFDKNQIGQVIDNLIINAQQAMPLGGVIELAARNITFAEKEHPFLAIGNYIKISVKDSGVGIPQEHISKIFDPFFTTKSMGHGLGLTISHSIVNRHGGCIDVESELGKGSTFKVYLPASIESTSSMVKETVKIHNGNGTFLIMDDEEVMRDTIGDMLGTLGYTVVSKENGKEAVDFFVSETKANRKISGIIFDLTVPGGMGGKAAIEEIRKINTDIPAFVASGYADDAVMKNPEKHGFTASICKPFRKSELSEMLNKYM